MRMDLIPIFNLTNTSNPDEPSMSLSFHIHGNSRVCPKGLYLTPGTRSSTNDFSLDNA
jgi:hypothetical protein